jgi:general secretion pathway protein C
MTGMKVAFVRPGGIFARLGLQSGDTLRAINGLELTSPERVLEAYARFRTAPRLSVVIARDGQPMQLDVEVR